MDKKKMISAAIITVSSIAAVSAASAWITSRFISVAIDRTPPKFFSDALDNISGSSNMRNMINVANEAADKLKSKTTVNVETTSFDNEKLVAHYYRCDSPKRLIIAFHGWRSTWAKDFGMIADFWHDSDCDVLFVEQRGQNNSSGKYMGFGLLERYDCLTWVNWAVKNQISLPIYLVGLSMGASTVLMASGLNLPPQVHGIIADCAFTSPHDIWKHVTQDNLHLLYSGFRSLLVEDVIKKKFNAPSSKYSCEDALKNNTIPTLFIHGSDDHFVPVNMAFRNYKACASKKYLYIVPGADHGMSYIMEKDRYEKLCRGFWKKYDDAVTPLTSNEA